MKGTSEGELQITARKLIDAYPDDLDHSFENELCQFVAFASIYSDDETDEDSTELFLYRLIKDKNVEDTFPQVETALRIYLVLMVSNCSGERSFSKLKLIENRLRTIMKQQRLVNLTVMSIESDVLRELNFDEIVEDFAISKARKAMI